MKDFILGGFTGVLLTLALLMITSNHPYDINDDGAINIVDLSVLAAYVNEQGSI